MPDGVKTPITLQSMFTPMIIGADGTRLTGGGIPGTPQDGAGDGAGTLTTEVTGMLDGDGTILTTDGVGTHLITTDITVRDGAGTIITMVTTEM